MREIPILIIILISLCGCQPQSIYDESVEIPETGWHKNNVVKFSPEISDTTSLYNIAIKLKHQNNYQYSNLWLFVKLTTPNQNILIDTVNFLLTTHDHFWLGKKQGNSHLVSAGFGDSVKFVNPGIYTFEIQQGLRGDVANSIDEIGLTIKTIK